MLRALLPLAAVLMATPAAASAATTAQTDIDGRIAVTTLGDEVNHVRITREDIALPVGVWDDKAGVVPGRGCWVFEARYVQCPGGSPVVDLAGGDDTLTYHDDTSDVSIGPAKVDGGTGDDTITTAMSNDQVSGGPGADELNGFIGDDVLHGDAGDDRLDGSYGADVLIGHAGKDTVLAGPDDDTVDVRDGVAGDVVRCHDGADTVKADRGDDVGTDCETVDLPSLPAPPDEPKQRQEPAQPQEPRPVAEILGAPVPDAMPVRGTPEVAAPDRRAPRLTVVRRQRRAGRLAVTVRCDEACTVTARSGRRRTSRTILAGRTGKLRLRGRSVTLSATDAAGNRARRVVVR